MKKTFLSAQPVDSPKNSGHGDVGAAVGEGGGQRCEPLHALDEDRRW